jgi:hypothetical protein
MDADLKRISNPLEKLLRGEEHNQSQQTKIHFDYLHLSPLKVITTTFLLMSFGQIYI